MLRALVALALLSGIASAEEEDPKAAIASRGIVLQAGKRHVVVIVPVAVKEERDDPSSKLFRSTIYFGDPKTLFTQSAGSWRNDEANAERIDILDPREIFAAKIFRNGSSFTLRCADWSESRESRRTIQLTPADAKTTELVAKAPHKPLGISYYAYLLTRIAGTTQYLYVDRGRGSDSQTFRMFIGKRGAMKKIAVKEAVVEATSVVLATAKGTLSVTEPTTQGANPTATFGPANKAKPLEVLSTYTNRELIYRDLGVYTRDRTGFPCDEL